MHILKIITFLVLLIIFSRKAQAEEVSIKLQTNIVASNKEVDLEVRSDLQKNTFLVRAVLEDSKSEKLQIKDKLSGHWISSNNPILKQPLIENIEKIRIIGDIREEKFLKFDVYDKTGKYIGATSNIKIFPKNNNYLTKINTNIVNKPKDKAITEDTVESTNLEVQTKQIEVKTLFKMTKNQKITLIMCFFISIFIGYKIDLVFKEYWNIS